jgi:hypothetical protein
MSQTTMKSSSSRLSVTRFAIDRLYEWSCNPKPCRGRPSRAACTLIADYSQGM